MVMLVVVVVGCAEFLSAEKRVGKIAQTARNSRVVKAKGDAPLGRRHRCHICSPNCGREPPQKLHEVADRVRD